MTQFDQDIADFEADEAARIATLHATAPAKIYLQIDPEAEQFDGWDAQTWCSDKINSTDLCYVRKSDSDAEIAALKIKVAEAESSERVAHNLFAKRIVECDQLREQNAALQRTIDFDQIQAHQETISTLREQVKVLRDALLYERSLYLELCGPS